MCCCEHSPGGSSGAALSPCSGARAGTGAGTVPFWQLVTWQGTGGRVTLWQEVALPRQVPLAVLGWGARSASPAGHCQTHSTPHLPGVHPKAPELLTSTWRFSYPRRGICR